MYQLCGGEKERIRTRWMGMGNTFSGDCRYCTLTVQSTASKEASSSSSQQAAGKKCGKTVPQLGEQAVQSIPPLIVPTHASTGADQLVMTDDHKRQAAEIGCIVEQLLGLEPMETFKEEELKRKYVCGEPLVKPEEVKKLSTRMYELHQWYMEITKTTNRQSLMVKVKAEHYFH